MRILLAGVARSGSTWVGNVLDHADGTRHVYEPDGAMSDVLGAMVARRLGEFPVLTEADSNRWYKLVWDLAFAGGWPWDRVAGARAAGRGLRRVQPTVRDLVVAALARVTTTARIPPKHVVVKSVNSMFALDWIMARYAPKVVVLRRNPLNVVSSWVVLNMWTDRAFGSDDAVHERYIRPLGLPPPSPAWSAVRTAAWNVGLLTHALHVQARRHPDWIVVSHDDLCQAPVAGFKDLAARIGLAWSPAMAEYIRQSDEPSFAVHHGTARLHPNALTSTTNGSRRLEQGSQFRRRLTEQQAEEARAVLRDFDLGIFGEPAPGAMAEI